MFEDILNDRLTIIPALRDDKQVAQIIATTKTIDSIHNLEEAAILDWFMAYLSEVGVLQSFWIFNPATIKV
jgi:hypothetical protein